MAHALAFLVIPLPDASIEIAFSVCLFLETIMDLVSVLGLSLCLTENHVITVLSMFTMSERSLAMIRG